MTSSPLFLRVWPGCEMAVPNTTDHLTGWVLYEQGRWFESEITLLPKLLEPGATFVDVGANLGVYSMIAAHVVGSSGRVVAFEPTPQARSLLEAAKERNGFTGLVMRREALADHIGEADLFFDAQTELASLSKSTSGTTKSIRVPLTTLDAVHAEMDLSATSLIKLDAEGAEESILRGAGEFLRASDPVILHEIKVGTSVDLRVANILAEMGYAPYRHLPGLDILVPFVLTGFVDPYQLNLFGVSASRADKLARRGVLAEKLGQSLTLTLELGTQRLTRLPYARHLASAWSGSASADKHLWMLLALHAFAHEEQHAAADRWAALEKALTLALDRVNERATVPRLLTATRLAAETGMRGLAVRTVRDALQLLRSGTPNLLDEPFLMPDATFDAVRPAGPVEGLVFAAALRAHERLRAFSSFFTGVEALEDLRFSALLGYSEGEMSRRLELVTQRASRVSR